MRLPELSIRRPILAVMMNLALVVFGLVALSRLPVRELPDIDPPIVTVTTVYPGANAQVVETEITERLEDVINGVEGIRKMTSESREQVSNITVEFDLSRPIDLAAQDVRDRVGRVREVLPDDADDPVVAKQDSDARPILWVALYSDRHSTLELTTFAENVLKDRLATVPGVSSIFLGGAKRYAVRIFLDSEKMAARKVTVLDVERALQQQNVELPSGRVENLQREMVIQTRGELKDASQFDQLVVRRDGGALVRLRDVGQALDGVEDERTVARYNGKPAMGLGVVRQAKANTIEVAEGIMAELERSKPLLPPGVETHIAYDESVYVKESIREVWETLFLSFLLVVATIYLFIGDARSTFVPSATIPVAVLATFAVLSLLDYSVNILTMLALVLAIGIVVDDSILVLENIYRHIEEGKKPMEAAVEAMKEIEFAVIATTIALIVVFLPMTFQTTITGRLFIEFAMTLCGSVALSSFIALTLSPTVSARLLKPHGPGGPKQTRRRGLLDRVTQRYGEALQWCLSHRRAVVAAGLAATVAGGAFYALLDKDFLPEEDKGNLFAMVIAPEGSTAEYTDRMVRKMEAIILDLPELDGFFTAVALPMSGPGQGNMGLMFARFDPERDRSLQDMMSGPRGLGARLFGEVEGALAFAIMPKAIAGGFGQPFQLVVQNPDLEALARFAAQMAGELQAGGWLTNVRSQFSLTKPELTLEVDRDRAASLGVSIQDLSRTLQILFGGMDLSTVKKGGKEYEVIAQLRRESRLTPSDLDRLYVRSASGALVQLSAIVRRSETAAPNAIHRFNRLRSATIEGTVVGIPLGDAVARTEGLLRDKLPPGFRTAWDGEAADLAEAGGETLFVVALALLIIYMTLAAQFESLVHPLTIMLALPLAVTGAFGLLYGLDKVNDLGQGFYGWAHYSPDPPFIAKALSAAVPRIPAMSLNLFSMIGIVLLLGLVTKNSILLVEFANQKMEQGASARDAVLAAGRIRLRPILMTATSTIAGILPIAIGFGVGAEGRRPMGVAAVGGMAFSTFLTLFLVPVAYTLFADLAEWLQRRRSS